MAPEFELLNSATAISYINLIFDMLLGDVYMDVTTEASPILIGQPNFEAAVLPSDNTVTLDLSDEIAASADTEALVDRLDLLLAGGTLSQETKNTIVSVANQFFFDEVSKTKVAIYMVMLSPDYIIQK